MFYLTRCPYCRQAVRMPDRAMGVSLKCPACQTWYTAAPEMDATGQPRRRTAADYDATPLAPDEPTPLAPEDDQFLYEPDPLAKAARRTDPRSACSFGSTWWTMPVLVTWLGCGLALGVALFAIQSFWARPVLFATVILGLGATWMARQTAPLKTAIGTGISFMLCLIVILRPTPKITPNEASQWPDVPSSTSVTISTTPSR